MNKRYVMWGALLASLAGQGCSSSIDVGNGSGGSPSSTGSAGAGASGGATTAAGGAIANATFPADLCTDPTPLPTWPNPADCVTDNSLAIAGTWHGAVDNTTSPWDDLTLVIKGRDSNGDVCGTLSIGSGTPPPPATDPNVGYAPDPPTGNGLDGTQFRNAVPGYPLTLLKTSLVGARLTFGFASQESRRSWCQLQTSYVFTGTECACLPGWGGHEDTPRTGCSLYDPVGNQSIAIDCSKYSACSSYEGQLCTCNENGCDGSQQSYSVDLTFDGDNAVGTLPAGSNRVLFERVH